ncbi:hypothetical protein Tco_0573550 [Tanacetum coccineum]
MPLPAPSTSRRVDIHIPEADMPPRKRLLLTTPRPRCEVGESFATAAARQPGPTMACRVDCSSIDTVETRVRDTERRMMAALEVVNLRVSYQVDVRSRESWEFYSRYHNAQKDRAALRAVIEGIIGSVSASVEGVLKEVMEEGDRVLGPEVAYPDQVFLSSILLLVVMVVIVVVMVILVVVVVAIIGVVIVVTIIGVVVVIVGGVPSIIKLSFVIVGSLHRTML